MRGWIGGVLAVGLALLTGCGGGGGGGGAGDEPIGTWELTFNTINPRGEQETFTLHQDGDAITGQTSGGGSVTGSADGGSAAIVIVYQDNYTITMNLTINVNIITGSFTDSEGRQGTVTATGSGGGGNAGSGVDFIGTWTGTVTLRGDTANVEVVISAGGAATWTTVGRGSTTGSWTPNGSTVVITCDDPSTSPPSTFTVWGSVSGTTMQCTAASSNGNSLSFTLTKRQ